MKRTILLVAILALSLSGAGWSQEERGRHSGFGNGGDGGNQGWGGQRDPKPSQDRGDEPKEGNEKPAKAPKRSPASGPVPGFKRGPARTPKAGGHFSQGGDGVQRGRDRESQGFPSGNRLHHFSDDARPSKPVQRVERPRLSPSLQRIGVRRIPGTFPRHDQMLRTDAEHSKFTPPPRNERGETLRARILEPKSGNAILIQKQMKGFAANPTFLKQVNLYNDQERLVNHYYWHSWNGNSYCHYYDPWGYHWYGWYWHGNCFWSRWYNGYWWWYDPAFSRWCYWNDGYWWWNDPFHVDVVYVYHDGDYVASAAGQPTVPEQAAEVDFRSKDGTRTVKVFGKDAFLYDTSEEGTGRAPVYLASNVKEVKFSRTENGKPLQIMLVLEDGSFEMFDSDGNPYNSQVE